ncbi:DUF2079 domain-containing protein [Caldilinea sp.]|uniref:DUF2079 domain-containing protein n=1 Tax=Caldilinea sp. TaxID=2293560 RepID=UPI002B5BBF6E|nr:DUF2079 domain-containing protein [Caldilinea sp.]
MNPSTPRHPHSILRFLPLALLALAVLLYAAYFSYLTLLRYHTFEARALDLGNLNQAIWNTAHGDWFRLTNQETDQTNRLAYHVEPILLPIALLYRLYPAPESLLVFQTVIVALGAIPLFALARWRGLGDWLGLVFALAYLLNPTIQAANWLEFHPVTLAPTLLMATFYFLAAGRTRWFVLFAILSASCKEEIGLLVAMMGLYAWLVLRRPRLGGTTALLAGGWSLFAVLGIQSAVAGGNIHWGRYAYLGETATQKLVSLMTRPDLLIAQLQQAGIGRYFFELLLPVGFTALLAPEVLLLALPSLAINLLADFAPMHQVTTLIYAAPVLPFVMLAAVMGVARAQEIVTSNGTRMARIEQIDVDQDQSGSVSVASTLQQAGEHRNIEAGSEPKANLHPSAQSAPSAFYWTTAAIVLGGALLGQRLWGVLPGSGHYLALTETDHHRRAQVIMAQIPPDAAVSAQDRLNPHVSGRRTVYIFPRVDDADYVWLDVTGPAWPQHPSDLKRDVDTLLANDFGIAAAEDGYLLLQRGAKEKSLPAGFFSAWQAPTVLTAADARWVETSIVFGDASGDLLALRGYTVGADRYGELVVTLVWEALRPLARDLRFYVGYLDRELQTLHDSRFYPPTVVLWYPTSLWTPGKPVFIQTLPWTLDAKEFVLGIGVYADESGWEEGARLSVRQVEPPLPVLEAGSMVRLGGFTQEADALWRPVAPVEGVASQPLDAAFAGGLRLTGATLPSAARSGESLPVTLFWQADAPSVDDVSVFVQLLDATGANVAQWDGSPYDAVSKLPASAWPHGWRGTHSVALALPATLPPGGYTVIAGMYEWQTGVRLQADDADSVLIGVVSVKRKDGEKQ